MGALVTEPPTSADAVRAGGADCIGAEFIDELPAGTAIVRGRHGLGLRSWSGR